MNPFLAITLRTFTTWIMAAIINALSSGIYLAFVLGPGFAPERIFITGVGSLVFSVPGFFIFWVILLIRLTNVADSRALFRTMLAAGMIPAAGMIWIFSNILDLEPGYIIPLAAMVICSITASIMLHFKLILKINC